MRRLLVVVIFWTLNIQAQSFKTIVAPLPGENLAKPCNYELTLPAGRRNVRAVWVTFDRGRDIMKYYSDPEVVAFANRHDLALMMPHQCPAKEAPGGPQEMDMDPSRGIGRALFTALDQFANQAGHPELSSAKLILQGFSGTGALFAHFVGYAPDRVVAAIIANPGHYDPMGIDRVNLPEMGIGVPEIVIAGGADKVSGTQRPYDYFRKYRELGAPWIFLLQNETPHCCVINVKGFILAWLDEMLRLRQASWNEPLRGIDDQSGWQESIRKCPTEIHDSWRAGMFNVCGASIRRTAELTSESEMPAGWLPSHRLARKWVVFVKQAKHPTTSLP